jgi:hypothetical protein
MIRVILCTALAWLAVAIVPATGQDRAFLGRSPRELPQILPGTRANAFATIQGNALTATDGVLSDGFVRLRDARVGQIVEWQVTDGAGLFAFRSINPGSYVVEIVGEDEASVLAAGQVLNVGAGQVVSTIVKLPFRTPGLAGIFGSSASSADNVTSQAGAAGVLAAQISGAATCDSLK